MFLGKGLRLAVLTTGLGALLAGGAQNAAKAADPYDIHVILPLTGSASFVGQGSQAALKAEEGLINQQGGIKDRPVRFVFHDDQSSPQVAVQMVNRVGKVPVLIGSSISAMCNAMAPLLTNGPFDYCMSPGIHPPAGSYQYSSLVPLNDIAPIVFRYFHTRNWTKVALMFSTDASGQDGERGFDEALKLPENADIKIVARAHFNPGDLNVSAQMEQVKVANPEILIAWTSGSPAGTVLKGFSQSGMNMPLMIGQANLSHQFMSQYENVVPSELLIPGGTGSVHGVVAKLDPRVSAARDVYAKTLEAAKLQPENAIEVAWDPAMIVVEALRHVGPDATAAQIQAYVSGLTDYPGVSGLYDFKSRPNRGLSGKEIVITRWKKEDKQFEAISAPGGEPIK